MRFVARYPVGLAVLTFALLTAGCAADAQPSLRHDISRIVPAGSKQQGECDYASGYVENAPPELRCRFVVRGTVPDVTAEIDRNLRAAGFRVSVRRPGGPAARVVNGVSEKSAASIGVIAPGRPLFFQLGTGRVATGLAGIDVSLGRRK
jgi:hypothetical protein